MGFPDLAVLIVTYNRKDILKQTLDSILLNLHYAGALRLFIADDGSNDGTQAMLAQDYADSVNLVQNNRVGLGANANAGLRIAWRYTPFILQIQDDMVLRDPLDATRHVNKLRMDETAGYIRLWGVAGHNYTATLEDQSPELGKYYGSYWRIHWTCPDLYVASDRPHIKRIEFHELYGMYPEGLRTAETEEAWCKQTKTIAAKTTANMSVLCPHAVDTESSWEHIGWHTRWRDKGL